MASTPNFDGLLKRTIELAQKAGAAVMEVYESDDFEIELKADNSPLTRADKLAHKIIESGLKSFSAFPVISEEGSQAAGSKTFWLVDPIDGTKEFISRNDEFTVCIGLIKNGEPALGVVFVPAQKITYYGTKGQGAFKQTSGEEPQKISAEFKSAIPVVAVSRSHLDERTKKFVSEFGKSRTIETGSVALKICLVAEGRVSIFPRLAPTSLWDTAAADAIIRAANGQVLDLNGRELEYDPSRILNPYFLASAKTET